MSSNGSGNGTSPTAPPGSVRWLSLSTTEVARRAHTVAGDGDRQRPAADVVGHGRPDGRGPDDDADVSSALATPRPVDSWPTLRVEVPVLPLRACSPSVFEQPAPSPPNNIAEHWRMPPTRPDRRHPGRGHQAFVSERHELRRPRGRRRATTEPSVASSTKGRRHLDPHRESAQGGAGRPDRAGGGHASRPSRRRRQPRPSSTPRRRPSDDEACTTVVLGPQVDLAPVMVSASRTPTSPIAGDAGDARPRVAERHTRRRRRSLEQVVEQVLGDGGEHRERSLRPGPRWHERVGQARRRRAGRLGREP